MHHNCKMAHSPVRAGYYDKSELFRLSTSVGFPGHFLGDGLVSASSPHLQSAFQKLSTNKPISDRLIQDLLRSKHLQKKLEKVFNNHPADYNRKIFAKAMSSLKHRRLSFSEISDTRVAFELYACDDDGGMLATSDTVLQALKMIGRVMSPLRLESEIQKQQAVVNFPSRIQMYEFMDLVIKCVHSSEVEKEMEEAVAPNLDLSSNDSEILMLPDFNKILMTKDQQILAYLDQQYRNSLYKKVDSSPPIPNAKHTISPLIREESRAGSWRQMQALAPFLEYSQHQLFRARNGFMVFSDGQHQAVESLHASRQCSRVGTRSERRSVHASRQSSRVGARCGSNSGHSSPKQSARTLSGTNFRSRSHRESRSPVPQRPVMQDGCSHSRREDLLLKSNSASMLPSLQDKSSGEAELVVEDLSDAICRVCSKSVHNANNALRMSIISELRQDQGANKVACSSEAVKVDRHNKSVQPLPVVTKQEIERHRSLMYDLEWKVLRKKRKVEI